MKKPDFRPPSPPTSVADSWARIEAWLGKHLPVVKASLRPGVSPADLAAFEKAVGRPLPEDVRESYRIHDGQSPISGLWCGGVVFGYAVCPLLDSTGSMTRKSVLSEWRQWAETREDFKKTPDHLALVQRDCSSTPVEAIHCDYTNPGWIPLYSEEGYSASFGVDLDPGPKGVTGQVINFGRDDRKKYVLAWSWKQLLHEVAVELEAGNFVVNDDGEIKQEGFRKALQLKRPARRNFGGLYPEWSAAKSASKDR
jgi:cell wall assembly regulator SMI1